MRGGGGSSPVQLRVAEAKHRDVGKRRARIDVHYMDHLGIQVGAIVELVGKRITTVTVWPADEEEKESDIIRIDGQTRKNAGVGLNDLISVRKTNWRQAKTVTLCKK